MKLNIRFFFLWYPVAVFVLSNQTIAQNQEKSEYDSQKVFYSVSEDKKFKKGKEEFKYEYDNPVTRVEYEYQMVVSPVTGTIPDEIHTKEISYVRSKNSGLQKTMEKSANAATWINRGPYNVGGRTRALAIDVENSDIILAGGVSGGMWKSTDGGTSWRKVTLPNELQSVTAIAQDPRNGYTSIWYYTTGEYSGSSADGDGGAYYNGNGVYKSVDYGETWNLLDSTASNTLHKFDSKFDYCWNIKVNPLNGWVYLATYGGIFISKDEGITWELVLGSTSAPYSECTDMDVSSTGIVYATLSDGGAAEGIWRAADGESFVNITPTVGFPSTPQRIVLDIAASNENVVFFLGDTPGDGFQYDYDTPMDESDDSWTSLWKYTYLDGDGSGAGGSWNDLSSNIPDFGGDAGTFDSQGAYDLVIAVKPDNENAVFVGGTNLYRSNNGFSTNAMTKWIGGYANNNYDSYLNHHPDQHAIVFFPDNPDKMLSGHDGGVSYTANCMSNATALEPVVWESLSNGYLTTQAYSVALDHGVAGDNKLMSGFQDNGSWCTTNASPLFLWEEENGGDGCYCAFARANNGGYYRYSSSQYGFVLRQRYNSNDVYQNWTSVTPSGVTDQLFVNPFLLDPANDKVMYYSGGKSVWRNNDLTAIPNYVDDVTSVNWDELSNSAIVAGIISALDVSATPSRVLYFGTSRGKVFKMSNPQTGDPTRTDITGTNFPIKDPDASYHPYVSCVCVDPLNSDRVLVVFSNYEIPSIFYTENGGSSWINISGNLEQFADGTGNGPSVRWVDMLTIDDSTRIYFAGTSAGLYSTSQLAGLSTVWTQEGATEIGNSVIPMIDVRSDGTVAVATHGYGLFTAQFDINPSQTGTFEITGESVSLQVFPNPITSGELNIEFNNLISNEDIRVKLYNLQGMVCKEIVVSPSSNNHTAIMDLSELANGVYIINSYSSDFNQTVKVNLIR